MPGAKQKPLAHDTAAGTSAAVDKFISTLEHPSKAEIEAMRRLVLGAGASIAGGIKWKAPSFRTGELCNHEIYGPRWESVSFRTSEPGSVNCPLAA